MKDAAAVAAHVRCTSSIREGEDDLVTSRDASSSSAAHLKASIITATVHCVCFCDVTFVYTVQSTHSSEVVSTALSIQLWQLNEGGRGVGRCFHRFEYPMRLVAGARAPLLPPVSAARDRAVQNKQRGGSRGRVKLLKYSLTCWNQRSCV